MNWTPKYTITNKLLITIREIGESLGELKSFHPSDQDLAELEIEARELSSYASTSIEGNPLPLTDVKRLLKTQKEYVRDTEREEKKVPVLFFFFFLWSVSNLWGMKRGFAAPRIPMKIEAP